MFTLNEEQQFIVSEAVQWYYNGSEQVFQFDGPPGSGKSVTINEIIKALGLNPNTEIAGMSFIGVASIVMRMKGLINSRTIHSWIYNVHETTLRDQYGKPIMDTLLNVPIKKPVFKPVKHLDPNIKLIVIDEGYTVPFSMKKEIEKFGVKVLVAGDQGQLPPINEAPAYLISGKIYHLRQIMRQIGRDDILYLRDNVYHGQRLLPGYYGNSLVINQQQLTDDMLLWADVVICSRNKTRDYYNERIRKLLGFSGKLPQRGEKVICRKNNWLESVQFNNGGEVNLTNGLLGRVLNEPDISGFDGKMFTMSFKPDIIDVTFENSRCNYQHMNSDYQVRSAIRTNRYEVGNMFEYGYCISTWLAQGMQWQKVLYIEEFANPQIQCQLNNVGVSRASDQLIYVKM